MNVGNRIKSLRINKGLTQDELANLLGLKKAAIHKYETGLVENIKRSTIQSMAEIFDVSPCFILGWDLENKTSNNINLSELEITILDYFNKLNKTGQLEAIKRVSELTEISKYIEPSNTENKSYLLPLAAHDKDGTYTNKEKQHDLDIMNDDEFWSK